MRKRKQAPKESSKKRQVVERRPSTLIDCPACGKRVCDSVIGIHLDIDCPSRNAAFDEELEKDLGKKEAKAAGNRVTVASARFGGGQAKAISLSEEELLEHSPCEVIRNALPVSLADSLLENIAEEAKNWIRGTWWMFGKDYVAPRSSAFYEIAKKEKGLPNSEDSSREVSTKVETREASQELKEAAVRINQIVNASKKKRHPEEPSDDWGCTYALANWYRDGQDSVGLHSDRMTLLGPRPVIASLSLGATRTFRLRKGVAKEKTAIKRNQMPQTPKTRFSKHRQEASRVAAIDSDAGGQSKTVEDCCYNRMDGEPSKVVAATEDGSDAVDPNEDQTRCIKLRSADPPLPDERKILEEGKKPQLAHTPVLSQFASVDIPLPHNTLVIMWPPCQEEWRHEVPKCSNLKFQHHPLSGTGRLNLTFRMLRPEWAAKVPKCRCGRGAIMKARVGVDSDGKTMYYFSCDTTQGKPCGYFEWVKM
ncbi:hypothetical protein BSKO_13647 [Bryopsis sp. KO-2023]|nr:hypothetical protein BSKO_13647 [Bryopsis sp. KO-2023]